MSNVFDTTTERVRFALALLQNFTIRIVGILLRITDLCELRLTSVDSDFLPFMQSDDTPNSRHSSFIDFFLKKKYIHFSATALIGFHKTHLCPRSLLKQNFLWLQHNATQCLPLKQSFLHTPFVQGKWWHCPLPTTTTHAVDLSLDQSGELTSVI